MSDLSTKFIKDVAARLGADPAAVYAVLQAECSSSPFFQEGKASPQFNIPLGGKPKILFEPHVWWKRLALSNPAILQSQSPEAVSLRGDLSDILYQTWGERKYGSQPAQYDRLHRAMAVDRTSAVESVSYGAFQVMGYHWQPLGWESAESFYEDMMEGGLEAHAKAFIKYVQALNLVRHIRPDAPPDFAAFAKGYNGEGYRKNKYDVKMAQYYKEGKAAGL